MRGLITADVFTVARIVTSAKMKEEFGRVVDSVNAGMNIRDAGLEMIFSIIEKCSDEKVENQIMVFLSNLLEKEVGTIENADLFDFADEMKQWASTYITTEKSKAFFGYVQKSLR